MDLGKESQARAGDWAYLIGGVIGSDKGDSYTSIPVTQQTRGRGVRHD